MLWHANLSDPGDLLADTTPLNTKDTKMVCGETLPVSVPLVQVFMHSGQQAQEHTS